MDHPSTEKTWRDFYDPVDEDETPEEKPEETPEAPRKSLADVGVYIKAFDDIQDPEVFFKSVAGSVKDLKRAARDNPNFIHDIKIRVSEATKSRREKRDRIRKIIQKIGEPDAESRKKTETEIAALEKERERGAEDAKDLRDQISRLREQVSRKQNSSSKKVRRLRKELDEAKAALADVEKVDSEIAEKITKKKDELDNFALTNLQQLDPDGALSGEGDLETRKQRLKDSLAKLEKDVETLSTREEILSGDGGWAALLDLKGKPPVKTSLKSGGIETAQAIFASWLKQNPGGRATLFEFLKKSEKIDDIKKALKDGGLDSSDWYRLFDFDSKSDSPPPKTSDLGDASLLAVGFQNARGIENTWLSYYAPETHQQALKGVEKWLRENPTAKDMNPLYTGMFGHVVVDNEEEAQKVLDEYNKVFEKVYPGKRTKIKPEDLMRTTDVDDAKDRLEAYKKIHPQTDKTWNDFYEPEPSEGGAAVTMPDEDEDFIWNLFF